MSLLPYPGLRPFHRDEADIFFGRDEQVDQLLAKLGKSRFLAAVGPSGCGKSSLIHTGLLNSLEAGFLADVGLHWRIATLHPGAHPMQNLAEALVDRAGVWTNPLDSNGIINAAASEPTDNTLINSPKPDENSSDQHNKTALLLATLRRGPLGLIEALREQPLPAGNNLLIVVDQFEEIFRYRQHQNRDEADAFVALLLRSISESEIPIYVVITMRSDFLGDCALFPGLPEALNDSQFLTPRLTREQRRLAITGPAKVFGGDVEPALVNRLLNDMGADQDQLHQDQLPVLQHALMRLWTVATERGANPVLLSLHDYETLGGWDKTLSNHADQAYDELTTSQKLIAKILFQSLSERSGSKRDTRRSVPLQSIAKIAQVNVSEVIPIIEAFRRSDRSFLMPPENQPLIPETLIDISHESLIRQWQRMKEWVEQEAKSAETYRRLEQTALLNSENRAGLLQGLDLLPVIAWKKQEQPSSAWADRYGQEFDRSMHFLSASENRQKLKSIGEAFIVLMIAIVAIVMAWLWSQAETEHMKASSARALADGQLLRNQHASNYHLSTLMGIEAFKRDSHPNFALNQFIRDSLDMLPKLVHTLQHDAAVKQAVYSPDGKLLATASKDKTARLWDVATGKEVHRLSHEDTVSTASFSPDGKLLATASWDKTARLWDVATSKEVQRLSHEGSVWAASFSPDGKLLATASEDKTARLWDVATGKEVQRLSHEDFVSVASFSPDGKLLATASWDKTARLWDVATGKEVQRLSHEGSVWAASFSPDGKLLATASEDMTARLWLWQPDDLIHQLCERLIYNFNWEQWQQYFEGEAYRKTCAHLPVNPNFRKQGKLLVSQGKSDKAARMLKELNAADPALKLNVKKELQSWIASLRLEEAGKLLQEKKLPKR
jgi:roadblock/LC7 domain-containing protein